jgi:hypothetical protein
MSLSVLQLRLLNQLDRFTSSVCRVFVIFFILSCRRAYWCCWFTIHILFLLCFRYSWAYKLISFHYIDHFSLLSLFPRSFFFPLVRYVAYSRDCLFKLPIFFFGSFVFLSFESIDSYYNLFEILVAFLCSFLASAYVFYSHCPSLKARCVVTRFFQDWIFDFPRSPFARFSDRIQVTVFL